MNQERLLTVLKAPYVSEKSTIMAEKFKQFTFEVLKDANKVEIKLAVEHLFNVKVRNVSIVNIKGKTKRFRQLTGKRNNLKKALVSLAPGYDIDFSVKE